MIIEDKTAEKVGEKIAELLDLKVVDGKVQTSYGVKNMIGLARMMDDLTTSQQI